MRRITKSQMYGFRLNKTVEPIFQQYLIENSYTASEVARSAIEEKLKREMGEFRRKNTEQFVV